MRSAQPLAPPRPPPEEPFLPPPAAPASADDDWTALAREIRALRREAAELARSAALSRPEQYLAG